MEGVAIGHNFERGPSKDHSSKVWSNLAQWFLRRRLKCEKLTTDERTKETWWQKLTWPLARWAKKGTKRTNNDLNNTTRKKKDWATWTPLKIWGKLRCSGRVSSSCSTGGSHHVTTPVTKSWMRKGSDCDYD